MDKKFDIGNFVDVLTIEQATQNLIERFKQRRKELKITQFKLVKMSGVSYGSIRRFEASGDISLASLMKIANAMGCLEDFELLFDKTIITSLKEI